MSTNDLFPLSDVEKKAFGEAMEATPITFPKEDRDWSAFNALVERTYALMGVDASNGKKIRNALLSMSTKSVQERSDFRKEMSEATEYMGITVEKGTVNVLLSVISGMKKKSRDASREHEAKELKQKEAQLLALLEQAVEAKASTHVPENETTWERVRRIAKAKINQVLDHAEGDPQVNKMKAMVKEAKVLADKKEEVGKIKEDLSEQMKRLFG